MQTKAFNHPIQRFHRTHRTPFRLLLTCAALVISGCSAKQPVIYAIAPDLCTRHQVSVGDLIVTYELGIARLYPWREVESGTLYYRGIEGPNIVKLHPNPNNNLTKYVYYVPLDDVNNDYSYDGTNIVPGGRMGAHDYNKIGEDGEAYILWDGFYLVVYSASPEELDYALQESLAGEPVPCPEPYWQKLENNPACVVWNRYPKDWTVTWSGACVNGKAQGSGTQFVKDKEGKKSKYGKYEGDYKGGKRHGRGVWVGANGNRYEGDFKDDKFHGSGVYVWANGNRYEGEVKDGQENGRGVYVWANGDRYEGEFKDGMMRRGVYVWANGDRYEGEFKGNKPNGSGTLRKRDGRSYSGYWTNGCFKQGEQWATLFTTPIACGF